MLAFSIFCLSSLFIIGAILFIDCKIIEDLPENNEFKKWWKKHIIARYPED
jgi:hypothetical protein